MHEQIMNSIESNQKNKKTKGSNRQHMQMVDT